VLVAATIVSQLDRQILVLLVQPIRRDLGISDTQISLLQGAAFAIFYTVMTLPLGYLADRMSRRNLIIYGILAWSASTILCGLAHDFRQLFLARLGVGAGEACLNPAAYSLMSDSFPPERRGRAYGLFGGAGAVGVAGSLFAGSFLLSLFHAVPYVTLPLLGRLAAWQTVFVFIGIPGILTAGVLVTVREPRRRETVRPRNPGPAGRGDDAGLTQFLRGHAGLVASLLAAFALVYIAGVGYTSWAPTAYIRTFNLSAPEAGFVVGAMYMVFSVIGCLVGGSLGDRWSKTDAVAGRLAVAVYAAFIASIAVCGWWLVDSLLVSIVCGCIVITTAGAVMVTGSIVINEIVPNEIRGRMSAIYLLTIGVFGISFGPTAVALVTDYVFRNDAAVRYSIVAVAASSLMASAILNAYTLRHYFRRRLDQPGMGESRSF
jgi:MFS family permease